MADLYAKYNCTNCQEDITGLRIKCVVCTDFDLCLQCFSAGAEIGTHKNDHSYQFMDSGAIDMCLGKGGWSAREELLLLDAIEQYGFGNWEFIGKHIETRQLEEVKEKYITRYIDGAIGRLTWPATSSSRPTLTDHTTPDCGPLSPAITARLPPLDISPEEATQLGYMPQRDDFEKEYDNLAESLVCPLFVSNLGEDEVDMALKLAQVDMYTRRLRERARRRRVSRDFQLVSLFFSANRKDRPSSKKKLSKDEREFQDRMRVFTQFHTAQEHEQYLQNLHKERELKVRLSELARYRRNGLTRHEECAHFEQERLQHEEWKEKRYGSSGFIPTPPSTAPKKRERGDDAPSSSEKRSTLTGFTPSSCSSSSSKLCSPDSMGEGVEPGSENLENITSLPGYHLLTSQETKLCSNLHLKPAQYITLKMLLLKDHQKGPKKETISSLSGAEGHILNYLVTSGWITGS